MKRRRKSLLFISGNNPKSIQDAPVFNPDAVVFDLMDRVLDPDKDCARYLVKEALNFLDYSKVEVMVRINPIDTEAGIKDVEIIARVKPNAFIIPKATPEALLEMDAKLTQIEKEEGFPQGSIELIPVLETAFAIEYVHKVITSSPRISTAWFNAEGLLAEFNSKRTKQGDELLYARSRIAMACRAEGIEVIDTLFPDGNDYEGLENDALWAKRLGLTGKAASDGRQIDTIHSIFG
jgi:citrate lyase subunit beta / citryl-CoA lyase